MKAKAVLTPITKADIPDWKRMRNLLYIDLDDVFNNREMNSIINDPTWHCFFVEVESKRVGFTELSLRNIVDGCLSSPVPYIEGIFLYPEYRGKDLGAKVVALLREWSQEHGHSEIAADTELQNLKAQSFFKSIGFRETYKTVGFRLELDH